MAKFVLAGSCECPYYSKVELLADQLSVNLQHFKIHKIVKPKAEWPDWLKETCEKNGWKHVKSPIVWRELVDRGGKGSLIGGFNEFMEYAQCYYGVTSEIMTDLMLKMSEENTKTCTEKAEEEEYYKSLSKPIHVCITNASSPISYHLISSIVSGEIFGADVEISLRLLDTEANMKMLAGIKMETEDLAFPLLRRMTLTSDPNVGFKDTSAVFILDELTLENEKGQTDSRLDWLKRNAKLFETYAEAFNNQAKPETKVLIAGEGPVNFNAHVLIENTTNLLKQNIVAASRLQERRARALLAGKLKVNSAGIKDAIVWGDCSYDGAERIHVDVSAARCHGYDGAIWGPDWFSRSVIEMVHDNKWISTDFISNHRTHEDVMTDKLKHRTSVSAASAASSLMRDWIQGTNSDEIYSLGVESEGWYSIKECVFSLPVKFTNGSYQVVWDLALDDDTKKRLVEIEQELKKDIQLVFPTEESENEKKFDENAELISSMGQSMSPTKTPGGDKLEKIEEEESEEQPAVTDDTQPTVTEEPQPTATEGEQPTATEEEQPAMTEEEQPGVTEAQPTGTEETKSEEKSDATEEEKDDEEKDTDQISTEES